MGKPDPLAAAATPSSNSAALTTQKGCRAQNSPASAATSRLAKARRANRK